jgi:hypothetical protein
MKTLNSKKSAVNFSHLNLDALMANASADYLGIDGIQTSPEAVPLVAEGGKIASSGAATYKDLCSLVTEWANLI